MPVQEKLTLNSFLLGLPPVQIGVKNPSNQPVLAIGRYIGQEGEPYDLPLKQHLLGITEKYPARWYDGRSYYTKQPGAVSFLPADLIPRLRSHSPFALSICLLAPSLLQEVESELDHSVSGEFSLRLNFHDKPLEQLVNLLRQDAAGDGPCERLYSEYLSHALAMRVLSFKGVTAADCRTLPALPYRVLRRVLERMSELGDNLTLEELAKESGYSRNHFLRMFRAATGRTPHAHLIQLRVERAQELLMKQRGLLIDVALDCGFSSHSHMTRVFRKILGVTPTEYKRNFSSRGTTLEPDDGKA
jgi:AraC family transcriptional regulator